MGGVPHLLEILSKSKLYINLITLGLPCLITQILLMYEILFN